MMKYKGAAQLKYLTSHPPQKTRSHTFRSLEASFQGLKEIPEKVRGQVLDQNAHISPTT